MKGKIVLEQNVKGKILDISTISTGVYMLQVKNYNPQRIVIHRK